MKIKLHLNSSCAESKTQLIMSTVSESLGDEVLITLNSSTELDIYVLLEDLKIAIDTMILYKNREDK